MQVIVNKLLTSYAQTGSGDKTLLFLHGWADAGKTFDSLVKEFTDYTVLTLDLPGFGGTQTPSEVWDLEDYALFVAAFLDKLSLRPEAIIGHSNGGAIAIYGLAHEILDTDKLILIASAGIRTPSLKKTALRMLAGPAKMAIKVAPKQTQKKIRSKLYDAIGSDYLVAEHMQDTFKQIVSTDVTSEATKITQPTCLIYGESDESTPLSYGQHFEGAIQNAQLHTIPMTGHFVHQEQAQAVARIMKEFLK